MLRPLRRVNFYSICAAFGLSVLLILAGSRYTDNINYRPSPETHRALRGYMIKEEVEDSLPQPIPTNPDDGSPNIEKLLEKIRTKVKIELLNYNFTYSGVQKLDDLLMESGGSPVRNIIISTWRSGTTFLGEVLNAMPANFYHYEPLLKYEIIQIRGPPYADKALTFIKNMLKCDYNGMEDYFEYGKTHLYQFSHNSRLWDQCKYNKELCLDANFTARFCKLFPFQSMKIVRLRLRLAEDILEDKELKAKVVLLVRDPRAVMQSRQHRSFCQPSPDCWKPDLLCADMISDYVAASRLLEQFPDRLMVLRYEELALNSNVTANQMFKFLRLGATESVHNYLRTHTNTVVNGVSSTFRVSKDVPFKWINIMDFDFVERIQESCKEAMNLWGYQLAHNASHMRSKDFNPLLPYTVKQ